MAVLKQVLVALVLCSSLVACASREDRQKEYATYLDANMAMYSKYMDKMDKPLVKFEGVDSGGKAIKFEVNQSPQFQPGQQMQQDQEAIAWINFAGMAMGNLTNLGGQLINGYYNSQNNKYMWQGIGNMAGGGIKVDSGGGDVSLSNVGLIGQIKSGDHSPNSLHGLQFYSLDNESAMEGQQWTSPLSTQWSDDHSVKNPNNSYNTQPNI